MISTNATISYMKSAKTGPIVAEARLANGGRHSPPMKSKSTMDREPISPAP